ncbi:MAG: hypothetical protein CMH85_15705 [Novosphingobium sp.]|jgi:hypothetical protein|nr:hypothetical protein [Novosphingobium sp.]
MTDDHQPKQSWDQRREKRLALGASAVVRDSCKTRIGGTMLDISQWGCRIQLSSPTASPGRCVTIKLEGMESWSGYVRWANATQVGIEFERPLHLAIVDHLAQVHPEVEILSAA